MMNVLAMPCAKQSVRTREFFQAAQKRSEQPYKVKNGPRVFFVHAAAQASQALLDLNHGHPTITYTPHFSRELDL